MPACLLNFCLCSRSWENEAKCNLLLLCSTCC